MSFPSIPRITPTISLNRSQVTNLLLASVALEELGLAHIINAEGEKLQAVLDTGHNYCCEPRHSMADLITINREVRRTLQTVLSSQILLKSKLEDILEITEKPSRCTHPCPPAPHPPIHCCPAPNPCQSHQSCNAYHNYYLHENIGLQENQYYYSSACKTCYFYDKCYRNQQNCGK